ncbi:MAG: alpha/beta fold hydrolase [Bryobacteraceae bacterium]
MGPRFLSYIDEGHGDPVILVHGIPTWGFLFRDLVESLSAKRRVLAPDLLGFGFLDKRDCFDRSIGSQAEALIACVDKLRLDRADVVGHDIGGGVALRLAALHPARVGRLCVMNGVCYDSWPIELMLQFGHPESRHKMSAGTSSAMLKHALKRGFAAAPEDEFLDGLLAPYSTETGKISLIRNAAALNTNLTTEITHLLPHINSPTLILWGQDDSFQLPKYGKRLASDIPGAKLVLIEKAKHFVMIDQHDSVARELHTFLDQ